MTNPLTTRNDADQTDMTCRSLDLTVRADSVDEQGRSVEAVLATDAAVMVFDFRSFEFIEERLLMTGVDIPRQMPLLNNHLRFDLDFVLGSIRNIRVENGQLIGRLVFADGPDDSPEERAWQKVRQGHLTDVSVGYRSTNFVDIPPGKTQRVGGRDFTAGERTLRVTTEWKPREASVTPIGADEASKIRAERGLTTTSKGTTMPLKLRQYLETIGLRSDATEAAAWDYHRALTGDQQTRAEGLRGDVEAPKSPEPAKPPEGHRNAPQTAPPQQTTAPVEPARTAPAAPSTDPVDPDEAAQRAVVAERERVAAVRSAAPDWIPEDVIERAATEGWDINRATREFLDWTRANRQQPIEGAPYGHGSRSLEGNDAQRALSAGLMHCTGSNVIGAEFRRSDAGLGQRMTEQDADMGDRYRTASLIDLCREACRLDLGSVPHDRDEMIRAAVSTTALANVFTTSVHARLLGSYTEAEDTSDWCSTEEVSNFQTQDRSSLGKTGRLKKLGVGGTAEHATIDDSVESYKIARYAEQFVVDEQDIVNNNLDSFQRIPTEMGMAAANLRPDLVYSILLANAALGADATALFHANHNNLDANALSLLNIGVGVTSMMQQTQGSKRLNIRPRVLIVPGDLEFSAREFIKSSTIVVTGNTDAVRGSSNVIADLGLQLRIEGRIDAAGVTNPDDGVALTGSATNWFMVSAAGRTIVVGYLAGTGRRPQLRRFVLDRGQYGIGWDLKLDIGAKALDFRGCYQGNG